MPLYDMGEMGDVGRRIGTVMMFSAVGALVGPPISGAILNQTGGLEAVSYYAGEQGYLLHGLNSTSSPSAFVSLIALSSLGRDRRSAGDQAPIDIPRSSVGTMIRDKQSTASADRPCACQIAVSDPIFGFTPCPVLFPLLCNAFCPV